LILKKELYGRVLTIRIRTGIQKWFINGSPTWNGWGVRNLKRLAWQENFPGISFLSGKLGWETQFLFGV